MNDGHSSEAIPLIDEELRIEKVGIATGKVRISTVVDMTEEMARACLEEEKSCSPSALKSLSKRARSNWLSEFAA